MGAGVDRRPLTSSPAEARSVPASCVLVTGGGGFVGRYVVRELIARGYHPACLVRDPQRLRSMLLPEQQARVTIIRGSLADNSALDEAARGCLAAIHLVGIILEQRFRNQTFERVHVDGTRSVLAACARAGIRRYVHMSALGARPAAPTAYFQTKWAAEELVRRAGLDWTIFRPSIIHGPDGEFMQMMKFFATSKLRSPFMPYFGNGLALVQPVSVHDVATCFVKCLSLPATVGKVYELGGPERLTWKGLHDACAKAITGRRRTKISVPVFVAELAARTIVPLLPSILVPYKFDVGQVRMSQEDSTCDIRPAEETFSLRLRDFREELARYADQI